MITLSHATSYCRFRVNPFQDMRKSPRNLVFIILYSSHLESLPNLEWNVSRLSVFFYFCPDPSTFSPQDVCEFTTHWRAGVVHHLHHSRTSHLHGGFCLHSKVLPHFILPPVLQSRFNRLQNHRRVLGETKWFNV